MHRASTCPGGARPRAGSVPAHPVTVGTRQQFEMVYGKDLRLPRFIRQLVGLDRNAAKGSGFMANQVRFVETSSTS
jgi:hypothetical protein